MIIHGSRHRNVKRNRGRSNNSGGEREGEEGAGAEQMSDEGTNKMAAERQWKTKPGRWGAKTFWETHIEGGHYLGV
jgi:hypothetical protein